MPKQDHLGAVPEWPYCPAEYPNWATRNRPPAALFFPDLRVVRAEISGVEGLGVKDQAGFFGFVEGFAGLGGKVAFDDVGLAA